ncbi:MAG: hypothetical protein AUI11_10515 [Acidobacteria bacterium 13_2_20CM_2_66_4]|nr:MAG: hypothetical protein AUI11_10515 [Acidobacteria bacterium 13_2_20CM_2_66_4]
MMTTTKTRQITGSSRLRLVAAVAIGAALFLAGRGPNRIAVHAQTGCGPSANAVGQENCLPGNSDWDLGPSGNDGAIQGYAADISVNKGQTVEFKIKTDATSFRIEIFRLGYYGGLGARKIQSSDLAGPLPQPDPPARVRVTSSSSFATMRAHPTSCSRRPMRRGRRTTTLAERACIATVRS